MQCIECHHENPAEARFCNACGRRLSAPEQLSERRQLTVLFADLVDSTKHASRFDPEDWSSVLRRYHAAAARCADEYDGHVAQYLGDGVMVYFGYPISHEDSAERALRCALAIRIALEPLNSELLCDFDVRLQIRIGVHTGLVVVERLGQKNKGESLALGNTPNVAARLQALAPPDGIVASRATLQLAGSSAFAFTDIGEQQLKGLSEPVASVQIHGLDTSPDSAIEQPLSFVGRVAELAILEHLWQRTLDGSTVVALVTGDPGIGKTRLLTEFRSRLPTSVHGWLQLRCSSFDNRSPFAPAIQCLSAYLLPDGDDANVATRLDAMGLIEPRQRSALYELLQLPSAGNLPVIGSSIEKRELSMQGMLALFESAASTQPLIVCVEDVHWADPSTLELLQRLAARLPPLRLLLLLTARGDPAHGFAAIERVPLSGLASSEAAALMREALGSPDDAVVAALTQRSDGVPLFVEELAKAIGSRVDRKVDDIPASLHDLLRAQLDRLGEVRDTAHAGAILGREFGEDVLMSVTVTAPDVTCKHIERLIGERVWRAHEPGRLSFRHALIQEEAYSSILRRDRRALHARVAETLAQRFSETPLHVLAHHRGEAEQFEEAAKLWYRAADLAKRTSANYEALGHLQRGLATLYKLPETAVRHRLESRYQLSLGQVYSILKSLYDTQAIDAYRRARDLSLLIEDKPSLFASLASLQANSVTRERIEHSRELADQLLELARPMPAPYFRSVAIVLAGMTEYAAGNIAGALDSFEPIVKLLTGDGRQEDAGPLAGLADAYLGPTYWMAGRAQRALTHADDALRRAREGGASTKLADALNCNAQVQVFAGNAERVLNLGGELTVLAQESNYNQQLLNARFIKGLGTCLAGDRDAGVAELLSANDSVRFQGLDGYFSWYQHDIAGQLLCVGRSDEARAVIERAIAVLNEFGGGANMPALLNHQAVLLQRGGDEVAAEDAWRAAFTRALSGGAFGWSTVVLEQFEIFLRAHGRVAEAVELRTQVDARRIGA